MGLRRVKRTAVGETVLNRGVIPAEDLKRVQMVDDCERIEFMKAGNDAAVFDVRQAANMKYQLRTAASRGKFKAGAFDIPIS